MYAHLDAIELFLREAPIIHLSKNSGGGGHPSYVATFSGGVSAILKFEDEVADGPMMVRREAAAWSITRALGWDDLVSVTVLRQAPSATTGVDVTASVQVIWTRAEFLGDATLFPDEDVWRAAAFDALICATDRGGNNWMTFDKAGTPRLKLIDHGHAFGPPGRAPGSEFYAARQGQRLPAYVQQPFEQLAENWPSELAELPQIEINGVASRLMQVITDGVLTV